MKKRLLALALCLVMMTSLLPLTAAAATVDKIVITGSGFGGTSNADYGLQKGKWNVTVDGTENATGFTGQTGGLHKDEALNMPLYRNPVDGETYFSNTAYMHLTPFRFSKCLRMIVFWRSMAIQLRV